MIGTSIIAQIDQLGRDLMDLKMWVKMWVFFLGFWMGAEYASGRETNAA